MQISFLPFGGLGLIENNYGKNPDYPGCNN